jgi:hypothetical protein
VSKPVFLILVKNMMSSHAHGYCEKKVTNLPDFYKSAIRYSKYNRILKYFYFHIRSIANFGHAFLMFSCLAASQKKEKENPGFSLYFLVPHLP